MNNLKILLMSDIHFGITVTKDHLDRMVPLINQVDYDILAVVGDLTDLPESHAKHMAVAFKHMKPRYGKYFVTGNHEYYTGDVDKWLGHLTKKLDFKVLRNEHVKIGNVSDFFYLAGVDDAEAERLRIEGHGMNFDQALKDCEQNRSIILLAHQPKAAKEAINAYENIELVLSGHTHGGQLLPMSIVVYLSNPFFAGLYSYKKSQVFVSQGAVYWGVPMRMFSQSEINLVHIFRDE